MANKKKSSKKQPSKKKNEDKVIPHSCEKGTCFEMIIYSDNHLKRICDLLNYLHYDFVYICHDLDTEWIYFKDCNNDIFKVLDYKKKHYHLIFKLCAGMQYRISQVSKELDYYMNLIQVVNNSPLHMLRYLLHLGENDKTQYNFSCIQGNKGALYDMLYSNIFETENNINGSTAFSLCLDFIISSGSQISTLSLLEFIRDNALANCVRPYLSSLLSVARDEYRKYNKPDFKKKE